VKWLYKVNFLFVWSCLEITIVYTVCHLKCYDVAIWMRKTVNKNHRILIDHMFSRSGWGMSYQRGCCQLSPKRLSMSSVFKLRKSDTSRGSVFLKLQSYEVCYCWGFEHILFRTSEHLHVFLLVWCTLRKHLRAVSDNLWLQCTWPKDSGPNKQVGSLFFLWLGFRIQQMSADLNFHQVGGSKHFFVSSYLGRSKVVSGSLPWRCGIGLLCLRPFRWETVETFRPLDKYTSHLHRFAPWKKAGQCFSQSFYMFIYFPVIVSSVSYVCSMYTWILISYERCCSVDSWMVFISCEMLLWDVATRDQMPGSFQIFSNGMLPSNTDSCCPKWPGAYMPRSTPSRRTGLFSVCKCTDWRMTGLFLYSHYPSLSNIMSPCNQTWRAGNVTI
jgi:hypothetical protein